MASVQLQCGPLLLRSLYSNCMGSQAPIARDHFLFWHVYKEPLNEEQHFQLVDAAEGNVAGIMLLVMSNVCLTLHAPLCDTHEMSSSCNFGHRPVAMWAAPSAPTSFRLHGHSSKISRDDFMPCHPCGAQLNAEQHWSPNPPYVQDAQLRPVSLDQLLNARCTKLVVAAEGNMAGVKLLVMSNVCFTLNTPFCNTHEMPHCHYSRNV